MAIAEKHLGSTVILTPDSNITWRCQPELKGVLDGLSEHGDRHVIIDLTHVREISGYVLGLLASRCARLRRQHGDIRLANASEPIRKLLHVTNLDELFEQFDSADGALRSVAIVNRGTESKEED